MIANSTIAKPFFYMLSLIMASSLIACQKQKLRLVHESILGDWQLVELSVEEDSLIINQRGALGVLSIGEDQQATLDIDTEDYQLRLEGPWTLVSFRIPGYPASQRKYEFTIGNSNTFLLSIGSSHLRKDIRDASTLTWQIDYKDINKRTFYCEFERL